MKSVSATVSRESNLVRRRRGGLLFSSAIAGIVAGMLAPSAARAADECGPTQQGTVTCTPAANPYPNGIEYVTPAVDPTQDPGLDPTAPVYDLTVNLESGVDVSRADGAGVALIGFNDGAATLNAAEGVSIAVTGTGSIGVLGNTGAGDLTINTQSITASGRASAGINAVTNSGNILINAGSISVTGNSSTGITASSYAGNVTINAGTVDATGLYTGGINAYAGNGDIAITADRVTTAGGSFYNYGSTAIAAAAVGGDITIDVGQVSTQADYSYGVRAVSYGDTGAVNVTADTIATNGFASAGAVVQGGSATLNAGTITTAGDLASGAVMFGLGEGGATLNAGAIQTSGEQAVGGFVKAYYGGAATVNVGSVTTAGELSHGIYAFADTGAVNVAADSVATSGDGARGIWTNATEGDTTIDVGSVSTAGYGAFGIFSNAVAGNTSIGVDSVTISGDQATGILAVNTFGNIDIEAGTINTSGYSSKGITAVAFSGNITAAADSVTTAGDYSTGFNVQATGAAGVATVNAGTVSTSGYSAYGIQAIGGESAAVTAGTVTTTGNNAVGIFATTLGSGDVTVNAGTVTVSGPRSDAVIATSYEGNVGINVTNASTAGDDTFAVAGVSRAGGDVTIISNGTIASTGDYAPGVYAVAAAGGDASVTVNDVSTDGFLSRAVVAQGDTVDVTINGDVRTSDYASVAVYARAFDGGVTVTNNGSITTAKGGGNGIVAYGSAGVTISGTGTIVTNGPGATGIAANGYAGATDIAATSVITSGDYSRGVSAKGSGDVTLDLGDVTTNGQVASAIEVATFQNGTGPLDSDLNVKVENVTVNGGYSQGINAFSSNSGAINIDAGTVTINGTDGIGILSDSYTADTTINVDTVITTGAGDRYNGPVAIYATSDTGDISITSSNVVATQGLNGIGVFAATDGNVTIEVNDVRTRGDNAPAVIAAGGSSSVTINGDVSTSGANSLGVYGLGRTGSSTIINHGTVTTSGTVSDGIHTVSFRGDAVVDSGAVLVTGAGSTAIRALGTGSDVNATSAVRSSQATAIDILASGAGGSALGDPALDGIARLTVATGGSVRGGTNAVTSTARNATQIVNGGTITGGTGYAIEAIGGAATIANNGDLTGRLLLTANADRLTNAGTFILIGSSDFGAGADTLVNTGTVRLGTAAATQAVALAGLETFTNSGLVDLRNGRAGDTLTVGAYGGSGAATLGLDISFGTTNATVDRLNVTTATGSTQVVLNPLNGLGILIPTTTIVQASAASSPTAFTVAGGVQNLGFIQYGVVYNPTALAYQLVSAPNASVYRQAKLGEGLASVWNRSGDAITAHLAAGRDAGWGSPTNDSSGRLWLQMFGELSKRDERRNFAFNGLVQNNVDTGYKQDAFGGQIGFDVAGGSSDTGGFTVGVSGGYLSSTMNFAGNDRFEIDAVNGSVYAALQAGGFFVNGLAKYDHAWVSTRGNAPQVNFNLDTKANTWGGKLEGGFRAGSDSFFFEPAASIAYTKTDVDGYGALGGGFDFDNYTGLRGKAGARIGGTSSLGASSTLIFYVGGAAVHEFKGEDRINFTSGAQTIAIANDRLGTYGQGTIGLNIVTAGGVTGFIEGHGEYGDGYKGGGGRAGIRIKF